MKKPEISDFGLSQKSFQFKENYEEGSQRLNYALIIIISSIGTFFNFLLPILNGTKSFWNEEISMIWNALFTISAFTLITLVFGFFLLVWIELF